MTLRQLASTVCTGITVFLVSASVAHAQAGAETFTATAAVRTKGDAAASAPVTIVVDRKMSQAEADTFLGAFKSGGAEALRKALAGVAPTGSVQVGAGAKTPTRLTLERTTEKGRLLTIVTDQPVLFLGGGVPDAKLKTGYDFAVIDLELDSKGGGSGVMAPAAKVGITRGVFVVSDYSMEMVKLTNVKKVK